MISSYSVFSECLWLWQYCGIEDSGLGLRLLPPFRYIYNLHVSTSILSGLSISTFLHILDIGAGL